MARLIKRQYLSLITFGWLTFFLLRLTGIAVAQEPAPLSDPVVRGAWLYEGNCIRCHGTYQHGRVGTGGTEAELKAALTGDGCIVAWDRKNDGLLKDQDIEALVAYMLTWEKLGKSPDLPKLPPQPTPTPTPPPAPGNNFAPSPTLSPTAPVIDETIQLITIGNPVALGAWLYTQNCYRCHQSYKYARQGNGVLEETVRHAIQDGKTATSMRPFSRTKGGNLTNREIDAIVLYIMTWEKLGGSPALPAALTVAPTPNPTALAPVLLPKIPPIQGDARRGTQLYAIHCRKCHGSYGEGNVGPALLKSWPSVRPDLTVKSTMLLGLPGSLMSAWGQTQDGPLSNQEINDLAIFILFSKEGF